MKEYVKPIIVVEELIVFETAHSDPHYGMSINSHGHNLPHWDHGQGYGWGHLGCWINKAGNWNN